MRLAVFDEQGLGDRMLAANLLRNLRDKDIEVVLECHPRLEAIYRRSFPWIDHIYPTAKDEAIEWPHTLKPDAKCAVMSLAKFFWSGGEFDTTPYLLPNPDLYVKYREEFESYGPGPYYAFTWKGGAMKTNTKYRSMKLANFRPLIEAGGTWISMQYHEEAEGKIARLREQSGLPVFHCKAAQEFDYDHTLAALAAVDHTITVCNSVVHTCGAAGLPCTVLVPKRRAWRYPRGEHFPWYGTHIRMEHQLNDMDWSSVIETVRGNIESRNSRARPVAA